MAVYIAIENV